MTKRSRPGEFELIAQFFAPLAAANPGALGLADDAALIAPAPGCRHVVTTDTLIAGVHFRADDAADLIARKLMRVNLSDLAAMGAQPTAYLVAASLPDEIDVDWLADFVRGLAADQSEFGVSLLGGDTTTTPGPLTMTLTAIGEVPDGGEIRRSTAGDGDTVYVSGTIGDAALGLAALTGGLDGLDAAAAASLSERYLMPLPRVALGMALRGVATAAADLSDGLVADLGHICEASGLAAVIERALVPLSAAARKAVDLAPSMIETVLTGGDDYELVFTAPAGSAAAVADAAARSGVAVTAIGRTGAGAGVTVVDEAGQAIDIATPGYRHF